MDSETAAALERKHDALGRITSLMRRNGVTVDLLALHIARTSTPKPPTIADRVRELVRRPGGTLNADVQAMLGVTRTSSGGYLSKMAQAGQAFGAKRLGEQGRAMRWFGTAEEAAAWAAQVMPGAIAASTVAPAAPNKAPVLHDVRAAVKSTAKANPGGRITLPGTNRSRGAKPPPVTGNTKWAKPQGEADFSRAKITRAPAAVDYRYAVDPSQAALSGGFAAEWQRLRAGGAA